MSASRTRIYCDNAATSWPKPEAVYTAVERYQRELGAPAGRSPYREAVEVERLIADARHLSARLLNASHPRQIVFTANGTEALNLALHGVLNPGDHVVTSVAEHNSVLRPLRELESKHGVQVTHVACDCEGLIDPEAMRRALRKTTRLIALIHASNVTGAIQPVEDVGRLAAERGILFLVDAAQSLGHVPVDVQAWNVQLLAAPGHKGLLGPLGTGLLYAGTEVESALRPIRQGGTGTHSESDHQPHELPEGFEAGNLNVPGIFGLRAGLEYVGQRGIAALREHEQQLTARLLEGLSSLPHVRVLGPKAAAKRVGVVSITVDGYDPHELAVLLDASHAIQVRSGLHCAPRMHAALETLDRGGAVRFSVGPFSTRDEMDIVVEAVAEVATTLSSE